MRRRSTRSRLLLAAGALLANGLVAADSATALSNPCLSGSAAPLTGRYVRIDGSPNDDQIFGTEFADVIFGLGGNDVIKGLGGDDIICGGPGNDGINGGAGNDQIGAGTEHDLVVGAGGNDTLWGEGGNDALHGGYGADTVYGNDDSSADYLAGGPDTDSMSPGSNDHYFQDKQGASTCPVSGYLQWQGTYGTSDRLPIYNSSSPCLTINGTIESMNLNPDNDGDRHMTILRNNGTRMTIELMPRDVAQFSSLNLTTGNSISMTGLHIKDSWHGFKEELHPVFAITKGTTTKYSGPREGGSPYRLRPSGGLYINTTDHRYCWDELGNTCSPWNGGEAFYVELYHASQRLLTPEERADFA